jgi:hypothetical protein
MQEQAYKKSSIRASDTCHKLMNFPARSSFLDPSYILLISCAPASRQKYGCHPPTGWQPRKSITVYQ